MPQQQLDWSIQIKPAGASSAVFEPQQPPPAPPFSAGPFPTLLAQNADVVTWGNQTSMVLQPWVADSTGAPVTPIPSASNGTGVGLAGYICDPIAAGGSSAPQYIVQAIAPAVVNYCCLLHRPNGQVSALTPIVAGQITVVDSF